MSLRLGVGEASRMRDRSRAPRPIGHVRQDLIRNRKPGLRLDHVTQRHIRGRGGSCYNYPPFKKGRPRPISSNII
jgi:hypothetical protein